MVNLPTWGGQSEFQYEGSVTQGTWISWRDKAKATGWSEPWLVTPEQYRSLLSKFSGQEVRLGNYRNPQPGTIEAWLKEQDGQWGAGLALHFGAILVREGYAERATQRGRIRFLTSRFVR